MLKKTIQTMVVITCLMLFTVKAIAAGGLESAGILDNILNTFQTTSATWRTVIIHYAKYVFWNMALISMVWTFGFMALKKADIQEVLSEVMKFFAVLGIFYWLLDNGPEIAKSIIDALRQIGSEAIGSKDVLTPSTMMDIGFDIANRSIDAMTISPITIVTVLVAVANLLVTAIISVNMLLLLISAWILFYAGVIVLGFGGGRWTQDIAINYYKTVIGVALQTMTMILIVGIGQSFIDNMLAQLAPNVAPTLKDLIVFLVASVILLFLTNKLPPLIGGIAGGSHFGHGGADAGAALGVIAGGAAAVGAAIGASMGAASHAAGGFSALTEAAKAAHATMASQNSGSNSTSGTGNSQSSGRMSRAVSAGISAGVTAGKFLGHMGSHLAGGVSGVASESLSGMKSSAKASIAATHGGRVASKIRGIKP